MTNWPGIGASSGQGWFAPPDLARPRAPFHRDMPDSPDRDFTPQPAADPERSQLISHCENAGALAEVMIPNVTASTNSRVRSDVVYLPYEGGGAIFSVGSCSWCGSLSQKSYDNDIYRITDNVLTAFLGAALPRPGAAAATRSGDGT